MREGSWSSLFVCMDSIVLLKLWITSREIWESSLWAASAWAASASKLWPGITAHL